MGASLHNGGSGRSKRRSRQVDINVTPLIDVMLVLLIIFMIATSAAINGVEIDLPKTQASQVQVDQEPLVVSIDKSRNIYIMETKVHKTEVISKLQAITKENKDARIFVRADHRLTYGEIMSLVSEISASGFTKVALITMNKTNDQ